MDVLLGRQPRLQAFIAVVQGADVPIPASLQNFVQSYMRLSDIVAAIAKDGHRKADFCECA